MAILLRGMDRQEIAGWTQAMISTGERMDFSSLTRPDGTRRLTADKHSTGGSGGQASPFRWRRLVASYGVPVLQLSGRGLGHTGGTLDKLESIPGWRAALSWRRDPAPAGHHQCSDLRSRKRPGPGR